MVSSTSSVCSRPSPTSSAVTWSSSSRSSPAAIGVPARRTESAYSATTVTASRARSVSSSSTVNSRPRCQRVSRSLSSRRSSRTTCEVDPGPGRRLRRRRRGARHAARRGLVVPAVRRGPAAARWRSTPGWLPARVGRRPAQTASGTPCCTRPAPAGPAAAPAAPRSAPPARPAARISGRPARTVPPRLSTSAVRGSCGSRAITGSRSALLISPRAVPVADQQQPQGARRHPVLGEVPFDRP